MLVFQHKLAYHYTHYTLSTKEHELSVQVTLFK